MLLVISALPSLSMLCPISWAMPQPKRLLAFAPSGSWFRGAPPTMPEQEP